MDDDANRITLCFDSHRYIGPAAVHITNLRDLGNEHKKITKAMNKYFLRWKIMEMDTIIWLYQDLQSHLVLCWANIWKHKMIVINMKSETKEPLWNYYSLF